MNAIFLGCVHTVSIKCFTQVILAAFTVQQNTRRGLSECVVLEYCIGVEMCDMGTIEMEINIHAMLLEISKYFFLIL